MRGKQRKRTAEAVQRRAEKLLEIASSPGCKDYPAWLKRRAEAMIRYAAGRQDAHVRKVESVRKERRKKSTH